MADKGPEVGMDITYYDEDGNELSATIEEVGDYNEKAETWAVTADGEDFDVYVDDDGNWIAE